MTFSTGTVRANDLQFSYIEKGEGPLLLCMHGFPDIPSTFRYQLDAFADQGYRVVAPYMRGYSPTEIPQNGFYQTVILGLDTLALIRNLGYENAVLLGHDWGSSAVTAAAVLDPGKVKKLITVAVPYGSKLGEAFVLSPEQQRRSWYMFFFQLPLADIAVPVNDFAFIERLWRDWSSVLSHTKCTYQSSPNPSQQGAIRRPWRHHCQGSRRSCGEFGELPSGEP